MNSGMSEGMGLVVIVTGSSDSAAVAQLRSAVGQDETLGRRLRDEVLGQHAGSSSTPRRPSR